MRATRLLAVLGAVGVGHTIWTLGAPSWAMYLIAFLFYWAFANWQETEDNLIRLAELQFVTTQFKEDPENKESDI